MKLLNNNVLIKRLKEQIESDLIISNSEIKETSFCKVVDYSSECSSFVGGVTSEDMVCVYKHSGVEVDGIENADMVVAEDGILFKIDSVGDIVMNGERILAVKSKIECDTELILDTELSDTIFDVIATSSGSSLKMGDKICCPIGTGVDIIGLDGKTNRVFHKIEILFKL